MKAWFRNIAIEDPVAMTMVARADRPANAAIESETARAPFSTSVLEGGEMEVV